MYSASFHWLFSIIILINFGVIQSVGPKDGDISYCTLDQVKYGGRAAGDEGVDGGCLSTPDIDYTPESQGKDWTYYAGIVGSVASVVAPVKGAAAVVITNLFNNIAVKYGSSVGSESGDGFGDLINTIDNKINNEINRLGECSTFNDLYIDNQNREADVTLFLTNIESLGKLQMDQKISLENSWDKFGNYFDASSPTQFGLKWFSKYDDESLYGVYTDLTAIPLYYELRLPVFSYFINTYEPIMKSFFITKYRLCNDEDRTHATPASDCRHDYNFWLDASRELMEDMNIWLMKSLSIIRNEIYSYPILTKRFDTSFKFGLARKGMIDANLRENQRIDRIYFGEDEYGEAKAPRLDLDDDNLDVFIKMNDEGNKYCHLEGSTFCDTDEENGGDLSFVVREVITDDCKDRLNTAANNKREEFRGEVDTRWYNLVTKYLSQMEQTIQSFYEIPYLDESTGMNYTIPRGHHEKEVADSSLYLLTNEGTLRLSANGNKCLEVSLNVDDRNLYFGDCIDNIYVRVNQLWRLRDVNSDGYYTIVNQYSNRCIDIPGIRDDNSIIRGDKVNTAGCTGFSNQRWKFHGETIKSKRNEQTGDTLCLDTGNDDYDEVQIWNCVADNHNQLQRISFNEESIIKTTSDVHSNQCIKVSQSGNVYRGDCNGDINEKWRLRTIHDDGFNVLQSLFNNECLEVNDNVNNRRSNNANDETVNHGDNIQTANCVGYSHQRWRMEGNILRNRRTDNGQNWCLDVSSPGSSDGNVYIWDCDPDNDNQMVVLPGFLSPLIGVRPQRSVIRAENQNFYQNQCLTVHDINNNIYRAVCNGKINQLWEKGDIDSNGWYTLASRYSFECLDVNLNDSVAIANRANGRLEQHEYYNVRMYSCHGGDNQRWKFESRDLIRNKANKQYYCLSLDYQNENKIRVGYCQWRDFNQNFKLPGFE